MTGSRPAAVLVAGLLAVVAVYDADVHAPSNVLDLPASDAVAPVLSSTLPQGWGFFTRSPREESLRVYPLGDEDGATPVQGALAEPRHVFGLDRGVRAQGTEMALVNAEVPGTLWQDCDEARAICLGRAEEASIGADLPTVPNPALVRTVCGPVVLTNESVSAWAYRDLVADPVQVARFAVVEVTC